MDDEMKWFFTGLFIGVMIMIGVALAFTENPRALVRQGWFSVNDKVYRVVPAEVVEKRGE